MKCFFLWGSGAVLYHRYGGIAFAIWARFALGKNWSEHPLEVKEGHELMTAGPYRLVRHPIYGGIIMALLGTFIADGKFRTLLIFGVIALGMFWRTKLEEKLMRQQFPDKYPEYRKRTKSLIPYIF